MKYWSWFQTRAAMQAFCATRLANRAHLWMNTTDVFNYISDPDVIRSFEAMHTHIVEAALAKWNNGQTMENHKTRVLLSAYPITFFSSRFFKYNGPIECAVRLEAANMTALFDTFVQYWKNHQSFTHMPIEKCEALIEAETRYIRAFNCMKSASPSAVLLDSLTDVVRKLTEEQRNPGTTQHIQYLRNAKDTLLAEFEATFAPEHRADYIRIIVSKGLADPYTL